MDATIKVSRSALIEKPAIEDAACSRDDQQASVLNLQALSLLHPFGVSQRSLRKSPKPCWRAVS